MTGSILIVDDDPVQRRLVEAALVKSGYRTVAAESGETGLAALDVHGEDIALVVLDLMMPGLSGLDVLAAMGERGLALPVIVQTAQGGMDTAIAAMRAGAFDFLVKPASPERLRTAVAGALKVGARQGEARAARKPAGGPLTLGDLVLSSPAMERVVRLGRRAAASNIPVLIEGESGTGKELIARAIQGSGDRRAKPFVTVNCGAIPENLVESILFGHEKGSFTGATERHTGKFVEANGGTLFLDEIGDLPANVQVKLLRAVQEGEVDPVGGKGTQKVDIRLVSATHRDLLQRVKDGLFREDLYYRVNVFPIHVPPLRDRREDIPGLVAHFCRTSPEARRRGVPTVAPQAMAMLQAYDWPGNIRQLENAVFRALVLSDADVLTASDFPQIRAQVDGIELTHSEAPPAPATVEMPEPPATQASGLSPLDPRASGRFGIVRALDDVGNVRSLAEVELEMIQLAIDHYDGQMSEVARRLGIGRSTLYRKLKEYGIDPESGRAAALAS